MVIENWSWHRYFESFLDKIRDLFSYSKDGKKKNFGLIVLAHYFCGTMILGFAPSFSFILSFLCFFLLSSLLYQDRIVPLAKTALFTLIQIPSFYLLSAFLNFGKTFLSEGNFALAMICMFATYVALLVNIFFCQIAFVVSFRPKTAGVNGALFDAFATLVSGFRVILPLNMVALILGVFLFSSTELIIVAAYPIWTLMMKALIDFFPKATTS